MLVISVLVEVEALLLQAFSADVANVAFVLFVGLQLIGSFSQRTEGVKHETTHDVAEKHLKESEVDDVVDVPHNLKGFHSLTDGA